MKSMWVPDIINFCGSGTQGTGVKGGFFSESAMKFLQISKSQKKIFQKTILSLKFKEGFMGFENNFNGIYFHHHFYVKTGVKSLQ